jgi:hypothetical protein
LIVSANWFVAIPALAVTLYGTSLDTQGVDLLITIDPANGEVLSSVALDAGAAGKWPYDTDIAFPQQTLTPVSEPGSAALIGVGLLALVAGARAHRSRIGPRKS